MNFYSISADIASKWVSVDEVINANDVKYHTCSICGFKELISWDEFHPVLECESVTKNRKLPDLMLYAGVHWHAYNYWFVVSGKFKVFFEENQFTGGYFTPIDLVYKCRNSYMPVEEQYYIWQITGRGEIDYAKMGDGRCICKECHMEIKKGDNLVLQERRKKKEPALLDEDSWDGSDVFNRGMCTAKFAKKILDEELKGLNVYDFKDYFDYEAKPIKKSSQIKEK